MRRVLSTSPNLPDFNQANACSTTHSGRPSPARGYGNCSLNDNHHWKQVRRWWGLRFASSHCPRKNSDQIQHKFRLQARRRVIPFTHELWAKQVEVLSRKYRVITYDRRGHGQSEAPKTGYSPVDHAKDLEGLLDQLGVSRAHFVAHSRGGPILLQLLRLNPERVRSLTFVDASIPLVALPDGKEAAIERIRKGTSSLEDALRQREAAKTRFFLKVAQSDPATRQILNRMVDAYSPNVYLNPERNDLTSPLDIGPWQKGQFPDMTASDRPILLVVGGETDPYFINGAHEADRQWPDTRFHLITDTDHLLMLEAPNRLNGLLLDFFEEVGCC